VRELDERRAAWERAGEADEERLLDTLRRAHHAEVFRTLVRDVEGELTVEQVADDLSALADACWKRAPCAGPGRAAASATATTAAWPSSPTASSAARSWATAATWTSCSCTTTATKPTRTAREVYGAFVRKLITWLTLRTAAGELFDIDTALRPNGNSGLLVTSIAASRPTRPAAAATPPGPGNTRP
jgi:glutamate-ammonia-ligase adenylyltransferase